MQLPALVRMPARTAWYARPLCQVSCYAASSSLITAQSSAGRAAKGGWMRLDEPRMSQV